MFDWNNWLERIYIFLFSQWLYIWQNTCSICRIFSEFRKRKLIILCIPKFQSQISIKGDIKFSSRNSVKHRKAKVDFPLKKAKVVTDAFFSDPRERVAWQAASVPQLLSPLSSFLILDLWSRSTSLYHWSRISRDKEAARKLEHTLMAVDVGEF